MQWFYNMKIGKKLITSFLLMAAIAGVIGYVGISKIKVIDESDMQLYNDMTVPISQLATISSNFQEVRVISRDLILANSEAEFRAASEKIADLRGVISKMTDEYEKRIISDDMKAVFKDFTDAREIYGKDLDRLTELSRQNNDAEAFALLRGEMKTSAQAENDAIAKMVAMKVADAKEKSDANAAQTKSATQLMLVVLGIGIFLAIFLGIFISRIIGKPIDALSTAAEKMSRGDFNVRIESNSRDEVGDLSRAFEKMLDVLKDMMTETQALTKAAVEGKLDTRGDASQFEGNFREIVLGINNTLDAIIGPLNVAAEYVDRISKGDIPQKITETYKGDFNEIKNNLNGCIDAVNLLVTDINILSAATVEGRLNVRAEASRHQGDFRKIVEGMNTLMASVAEPMNLVDQTLHKIAVYDMTQSDSASKIEFKGVWNDVAVTIQTVRERFGAIIRIVNNISTGDLHDIDSLRKLGRRSDADELVPAFVRMIESIQALVSDTRALADAGVNGKLDVRADASKHQGEYRAVITGVNDTLDAVIGPLNVAAEYIDRISKGDIPPKVTDNYKGDFNEIKNNLNGCIDAVNLLIIDAEMLVKAAIEEKFDTRADAVRHQGDFRKIVDGMNGTLDTVVNKVVWYESILDNVPFPLSVTDTDMNWTFINSSVEKLLGVKRKDIVGKKCSNWNANICNTENCGIAKLRRNIPQTVFSQAGMNFQVDTAYIVDRKGVQVGHIEFVQDITAKVKATEYQKVEVDRLADNLKLLAEGNMNLDTRISEGDEFTRMERENFQKINASLAQVKEAVGNLITDTGILSKSAVEGKLDARADASKHQGDFRRIVQGVNDTLDAVIGPLNVAAEYIDRISKGDIPPKVTENYNGDFNEIKNNLNACIDGLGGLVEANAVLQRMSDNDYTVPVSGQYAGIFDNVAKAVNLVQNRINHTIEILNNISKGDLSDLDSMKQIGNGRGRRCDNDELVPTTIRMTESIKALVNDTRELAKAGVNGQLDVRADASKHQGEYRAVITGVNDTLDAVIGPLNVAAEYIDRISKGDIPPKVTDAYNGDFNEIKNNLNACIDGLGGLVESNAVLQRMALNDYTTTVDGKYQGVYAEVAGAVNDVEDRIKHIIAIVNRISVGDLSDLDPLKQMGNGKGRRSENDELVPAYIRMMENLKATIADIGMLAQSSLEGRLETRADASKHEGDFRKIVEGVNATLNAVIEPVNETVACIEQMAEGDLTVQVNGDYKGDLAKMKNALNATLEALNDILGQVNTASEQVVSGAQQVSDAAQSLSQGATEQASSLEEITASMTEMNSQTRQNAENAQQANKLAAAARDNAQNGNERMREMLEAMKEINDSSGQISKIIKVIDEIAFQTNLLALNAAVEAARAGVHGKGFAVVADEVRNLAQRSAKAAKETTELIENSIKKVENGTGIANETAKALYEIVNGVTKVTDLVGEIASASNEQAQGIAQVNQGLGQVDQVTQANTANAEESAAAAEELSGQATNLQHMITRFQLVNHNGGLPGAYGSEQYGPSASDHKSNGGNGKNKLKGGSVIGLAGKKPSPRNGGASSKQGSLAPAGYIALDDDEFGKY